MKRSVMILCSMLWLAPLVCWSLHAGEIGGTTTDWNAWVQVPGLPGGNAGYALGAGTLGEYMYAVGGDGGGQTNVVRINGSTSVSVAGLPSSKTRLACAVLDGVLYAIGGGSGATNTYAFDGTSWTEVAGLPAAREYLGAATLNDMIYAIGGSNQTNVYAFDGISWTEVNGLPAARSKVAAAAYDGKIYAIGGSLSDSVYAFDGSDWSTVNSLPAERQYVGAAAFNGYLYSIGGDFYGAKTNVYRFDGTTWTETVGLPVARAGLAAAVLDGRLYAIGGSDQTNIYCYPASGTYSGVAPESGSYVGGYEVTITGTGLSDGTIGDVTSVTLCGVEAAVTAVNGTTQIVVSADTAYGNYVGLGDVRVVSASAGTTVKTNGFTYTGASGIRVLGTNAALIATGDVVSDANGTIFPAIYTGTSLTNTFTIRNNSADTALTISGVSTSGSASQFTITGVPASIAAGASATFTVKYNPTFAGTHNATLNLANNSPTTPYQINLRGSAESTEAVAIEFTTSPSASTVAGVAFAQQPVITLKDGFGNTVTDDNTTPVTLALTSGSGTLRGTVTKTAVSGIVNFSTNALNITLAGSDKRLTATSMGLTSATSTVFAITHAAASELVFTGQPGSSTVGQPLSTQPIITIRDAFGNTVLGSSAPVTVGLVGEGALLGTLTKSAVSGVANFSTNALTVAGSVGSRQLTADAAGLSTVTSSAFTVRGVIDAIDPNSLYQTGGVTTITGMLSSDELGADITNVTLCGVAATIDDASSTQIVVTAGSTGTAGTGNVVIQSTSGGTMTLTNGFTYIGLPGLVVLGKDGSVIGSGASPSQTAGNLFVPPLVANAGAITNTLSITNTGAEALNITGASISGAGSAMFSQSGVPTSIGPGTAVSNFTVVFTPTAAGSHIATLTISNDSPVSAYEVDLLGLAYTITPDNGPLAGGSSVTITDGHYGTVTGVTVGGIAATIDSSDESSVTLTTPASGSTGAKTVVIQTSDEGNFTLTSAFTYNVAGYINRLEDDWDNWTVETELATADSVYSGMESMAALNGKLYLFAGTNTYSYDMTNWSAVAGCPDSVDYAAVGTVGDSIYMAGGTLTNTIVTNNYCFNGTNWTMAAGLPQARSSAGSCEMDGSLYVVGGNDSGGSTPITNVYSFDGTEWTEHEGLASANRCMPAASLSNKLYVSGGYVDSASTRFEIFDGTNWSSGTVLPQARAFHGSAALNGQIYIIGGTVGTALSSVSRYNGSSWSAAPSLPEAFAEGFALTFNDVIYAFDRTVASNLYRYPGQTGSQGVIPSSGVRVGGFTVTIIGSNLGNGSDITNVTLCGVSATSIDSQSATQVVITAGLASGAVTGDVQVFSTSYGVSVLTNGFAYVGTGKQQQTITFAQIATQLTNSTVRLSATASSGLRVSYVVASGPGRITGSTNLTFTGVGTVSITASQAGNETYDPAPDVTRTFLVLGTKSFKLTAVALTNNVITRWPDPMTAGFSNRTVVLRHSTNDYPNTTADGTALYTGTNWIYEHTGLASGQTNYYTVFGSHDGTSFTNSP